jgi:hypothetical protein
LFSLADKHGSGFENYKSKCIAIIEFKRSGTRFMWASEELFQLENID